MAKPSVKHKSPARLRADLSIAITSVRRHGRTIDWVINNTEWVATAKERALFYHTIRHYFSLQAMINAHVQKPLREKDQDLLHLMLVGAYQLRHSSTPAHAVINETVSATVQLRKPWAKGLINAVLRKVCDENISDGVKQSFDHADWLVSAIRKDYPEKWKDLLSANNTQAPMVLRVNRCRSSRDNYATRLEQAGLSCRYGSAPQALILDKSAPSATLPGWSSGDVAVQDMGAQYAAELLYEQISKQHRAHPERPLRILDACAAPGGKLANLHELLATKQNRSRLNSVTSVIGIDKSPPRIQQTRVILSRLGHERAISQGDAATLDWWDRTPFDFLLLDAPCSGTGTIRRHPDIKLLLKEASITEHARLQFKMLNNLWQTLAPGGTLLYCTCSLLRAENDNVIGRFLETKNNNATPLSIDLPSGIRTRYGWQLLPTNPDTDGFYYALLHKRK